MIPILWFLLLKHVGVYINAKERFLPFNSNLHEKLNFHNKSLTFQLIWVCSIITGGGHKMGLTFLNCEE